MRIRLIWSGDEKTVARQAFEYAYNAEVEEVMEEAKKMAAKAKTASDLWELQRFLESRHREIDGKYDYRFSALPLVFRQLIEEGRLKERDLTGLAEDKMKLIRE
jgi:hypothetical protein